MTYSTTPTYDVIIAGAGPVGLFLACELRLAGLAILILEQAETPDSPLKRLPFGMRGLSLPSVEALYRRGLLNEFTAPEQAGNTAHWARQQRRPGGHFAGIQFFIDQVDRSQWPYHLPGPADATIAVSMDELESILTARALKSGVEIERGSSVEDFTESEDEVTVQASGKAFRARWLVGCDGGRSTVRKLADIAFAGTEPGFTGYSVEVDIAGPNPLAAGRHYTAAGMYTFAPPGTIAMVDFDGGAYHRTQPITLEHVQAVLRRISGTEVTLASLQLATTWTDRAFQASTYRKGRVLLAGDAAHIHSPLGGQGLNLGLGDAMNLGWKLAAALRGDAPPALLDSYTAERHPIGARVLDWSRAQVALMRPSPSTRALAAIMRDLMATPDGATYFAERVWAATLHYELSGAHPLVGRSAPDFELADGTRLGELLKDGRGLLIDFVGMPALQTLASRWPVRLAYVSMDAKDELGLRALLVRPDGVVAWAADVEPDESGLVSALSTWFGAPAN